MQSQFADTLSQKDLLNRKPFARSIARVLVEGRPENNESLVFGLNGRWGSGKSTLLKFVVDEIRSRYENKNDEKFEIFEFNPWMFSGQEQLLRHFLTELFQKLGGKQGKLKAILKTAGNLIKKYAPIKKLPDEWEQVAENLLEVLGKEDSLENLKKSVDDLLVSEKFHLYVIMDDLDRLTPDEITQVFQLVKLNANFKNTVFLLAYDKDIVVNAVAQKFKDNGERYLAKIVQADYTLPEVLQEDVETIFFEQVEAFFEKWKIAQISQNDLNKFWSQHGLKNYFTTLRDVYRYFNGLALRLPDIWKEVNISHFMVVEAFRIFDYSAYQNLYFESLNYLRKSGDFPSFNHPGANEKFPNKTTHELLLVLRGEEHPNTASFIENVSINLFNPDTFERYFSLQISKIDLSEKDVTDFLGNLNQIQVRLRQIHQNKRLENLLIRLTTPGWESAHLHNIPRILDGLIQFFDSVNKSDRKKYRKVFEHLVHKFFEFCKVDQDVSQQLWQTILIQPNSFPQTTGFKLLFSFWDSERYSDGKYKNKQQGKIIIALRKFSRSWVGTSSAALEVNKLPMCEDDQYFGEMLFTLSILDSKIYYEFIIKSFKKIKTISWLLGLMVKESDGRPNRLDNNSPLFTQEIGFHIQKILHHASEEEIEELDSATIRAIVCFQNYFNQTI